METKHVERFLAAGVVLIGGFWFWGALQLRYYTTLGPGPGFFSLWLAGLMVILGLVLALTSIGKPSEALPEDFFPSRQALIKVLMVFAILGGVALALQPVGYRVTIFVMLMALMAGVGRINALVSLVIALIGSFGVYHVFVAVLRTPLPIGLFGI